MKQIGTRLRSANVKKIILVHGTFAGTDTTGLLGVLGRHWPELSRTLGKREKNFFDALSGDAGNYPRHFAEQFEQSINDTDSARIEVRIFHWAGENHHVSRADGAVQLIHEIQSLGLAPNGRILLWGHSHAGNVFALMSNLLGSGNPMRRQFFRAAKSFYQIPWTGNVELPYWEQVRRSLMEDDQSKRFPRLDIVTFGTPIRYGWDSAGYSKLMHIVNRRPCGGRPPYRAAFPPKLDEIANATAGDYVQQFGIAGTNVFPNVLARRRRHAERRLKKLLQNGVRNRDLWQHLGAGKVVADEGMCLLIDYRSVDPQATHLFGHSVYTRLKWLAFHAHEVTERFYGKAVGPNPPLGNG